MKYLIMKIFLFILFIISKIILHPRKHFSWNYLTNQISFLHYIKYYWNVLQVTEMLNMFL